MLSLNNTDQLQVYYSLLDGHKSQLHREAIVHQIGTRRNTWLRDTRNQTNTERPAHPRTHGPDARRQQMAQLGGVAYQTKQRTQPIQQGRAGVIRTNTVRKSHMHYAEHRGIVHRKHYVIILTIPSSLPFREPPHSASRLPAISKQERNCSQITDRIGLRPSLVDAHAEHANQNTNPRSARWRKKTKKPFGKRRGRREGGRK